MSEKVSLRSLGEELGVSAVTVMRALRDHPNVTLDLRRRIITLAQDRGYRLPQHTKRLVAIIIPSFQFEGYMGMLLTPLMQELSDHGMHAEIICVQDLEVLQDHIFDGCISTVYSSGLEQHWTNERALPLVVMNSASNPRKGIYEVDSDDRQGIGMGVDYLWQKGRRNIAFVTPSLNASTQAMKRYSAFCEFSRRRRLGNCSSFEVNLEEDLKDLPRKIIDQKIDAVFSMNETYAPSILFQLARYGMQVPRDVAVLTLENRLMSQFMLPPLTTLEQNFAELGRQAVQLLLRRIKRLPCRHKILVPYIFHERESC